MTDAATLAAVRRPLGQARGLPNAHYADPATTAAETAALLHGGWAALGVASQVPEAGDAVPVDLAGVPLLMLRDRDGALRVFQNVCRHRGMILVDAPRRIEGAIRCPYHSWCYATDGRLVATPHVGGPGRNRDDRLDTATLNLLAVRTAVWRDVVFVDLSGAAAPFEVAMGPAMARWAEADRPLHHDGRDFVLEVACNWKLAVENYCESYHLPWVHPGLNAYSRLEDHYDILGEGHAGQGTRVYRQLEVEGRRLPDFAELDARWDTGAEYLAAFPNALLGMHRDHAFAIVLLPDGPGRTREHVHFYYAAPDADAGLLERNAAQWREVFEEDVSVVEGMQCGRAAPGFDGGRFSPAMDGPTHAFHAWVAGRLGA